MDKKVPYILQLHKAKKAGTHFDFRIKSPKYDTLYSFVYRGDKFPICSEKKIRGRTILIRTFNHSTELLKNKKDKMVIPEGKYGAGELHTLERGTAEVLEWDNKYIKIKIEDGKHINGTYTLVKLSGSLYYRHMEIWSLFCK